MNDENEWKELVERHLRGELEESEKECLAELLDTNASARQEFVEQVQWDTEFGEALRESSHSPGDADILAAERAKTDGQRASKLTFLRQLLGVSALVIVTLSGGLFYQRSHTDRRIAEITSNIQRPGVEPPIARIIGLSGTLIWTGDRGQIVRDLKVGTQLAGGTIEGMAPDSWFELEFSDGSSVMISGTSTLTFSDLGQKDLRLREGMFSANVIAQPEGKPMLIHTQSALLKVLGTQFDVEAGPISTVLNVSEGKVRVKRLSDGSEVDVSANHRVIAGGDGEMIPERVPVSTHRWKSQLGRGPDEICGYYGRWSPATGSQPASMKAIPFVPRKNRSVTLYLLGLPVERADSPPVIVRPGSRFIVRGRLETATDVYFGIRVARANGEFAGKFLARKLAATFSDKSRFEAEFRLDQFGLDPCVRDRKDELPARPDDLILTGVWSFTHTGGPSGLEVAEVELIPSPPQAPTPSKK